MKFITLLLTSFLLCLSGLNAASITISDWVGLNTGTQANSGYWNLTSGDLQIVAGGLGSNALTNAANWDGWSATSGTSFDGWGAGTDSSAHGDTANILDDSYLRLGNAANQRKLDFMLINNGTTDFEVTNISFDWQNPHNNGMNLLYISAPAAANGAAADSNLVDSNGIELANSTAFENAYIESNSISTTSSSLGTIAAGDGATFRINYTLANTRGLDNLTITGVAVPEPSTYALIAGFAAFLFVAIKRRK